MAVESVIALLNKWVLILAGTLFSISSGIILWLIRRVNKNENDIAELKEENTAIKNKFDSLEKNIASMENKVSSIDDNQRSLMTSMSKVEFAVEFLVKQYKKDD